MPDKPIVWLGGKVKTPPFSLEARIEAGVLLRRLQRGELLELPHSRPMPSIGQHCHELRVVDEDRSWRIVYRIEPDAIVILDVFEKKTRQTPAPAIRRCKARLRAYEAAKGRWSMKDTKQKKLEAAGWRVSSADEFLGLSDVESMLVDIKLALSDALKARRTKLHLSQKMLAARINSSQSRVAKMEAADPEVSVDLLLRGFAATGATPRDVAKVIGDVAKRAS